MVTFCCLVIVAALIYYYMHRDKKPQEQEESSIVWQDYERKLYMKGNEAFLEYKGVTYTFGCQP